ncbi:hypothetical protein APHAL10511_008440 [Amanita phalloides]|nr:hypothetical protein APHAL10511_008440 [Amanita phalloides]
MANQVSSDEIKVNIKGPSELKLQIAISADRTVRELKDAIAAKSDVEADRQRLIYSGRVLKDEDKLSTYKIQSSHTIHMVKGVSRSPASPSTQQQLPTMQAGQNPHDPLTQLNSHLGFGAMAGLNPFAGMGLNQNDPNILQSMMNSPQLLQQMSSLLQNPEIVDRLIESDPRLAPHAAQMRETFRSPFFRELMSNPQVLQEMMQASNAMREFGPGGPGGLMFPPLFPTSGAPGGPAQPQTQQNTSPSAGTTAPSQPSNLFSDAATQGTVGTGQGQQPSPFGTFNPALMRQLMGMGGLGGEGAGFNPLGVSPPPQPTDTRPPEERFQVQLQQLQEMGFTNASQNVRALLATGGNVHSAIEYILSGGGL